MKMMPTFIQTVIAICLLTFSIACSATTREVVDFDANWKFALNEQSGAELPNYDDTDWRVLNVPHDWAFEADYAPDAAQKDRGGYKPGGLGWYRKHFEVPSSWKGQRVSIHFDAVYMNSEVWLNGHRLGKRPYGYIPFHYDLTDHLKTGHNVISVRVDSRLEPSARWYHGCGIYAHVKLVATDPVAIRKDGVHIQTPEVNTYSARVVVATELANHSSRKVKSILRTQILNSDSGVIEEVRTDFELEAGAQKTITQELDLAKPKLWSPESPTLYSAKSTIAGGDEVVTRFGVRTLRWDTQTGFWLNGKNTKLLGVADHLEAGPVGAAYSDDLIRWKVQLLKDMGCNAIRAAHNPQVPAFYDICDELGMLVMDEIFDGWKKKATHDYGKQAFDQWWERDLRAWLKANRNHPSVIIWSLGNETGGPVAKQLVEVCHEMDPTRLTTSGHSGSQFMDVHGVNGASERPSFINDIDLHNKPFVATEAPHTWQVRGYYRSMTWWRDGKKEGAKQFPLPDLTDKEIFTYDWIEPSKRKNRKQIFNSSYDNAMVRISARKNWELMRDLPWFSGHFRWTGFDYLGEAGYVHGGWPFRAFMGGALDLAGFEKDLYYFYQSQWTTEPMAHILPHWTHPKMEAGTEIPVWVYSNCDEVELFLNGKSLGKDRPGTKWDEMQCEWMVPWTPGKLVAIAYKNGREVARSEQTTAAEPAALTLSVEGEQYPILTVEQVDSKGVLNPYAENRIHYHIDGPARILSLESGNPVNTENNYGQTSRTAFFGLARCFLEMTSPEGAASVITGAILGEKQQMTSHTVSIDVESIALRGGAQDADVKILYSIDGSNPKTEYIGAFEVPENTVVHAAVYRGEQLLFNMKERFGPKEGLYWGSADDVSNGNDSGGDQAEDAKYHKARVASGGSGFNGKGYLDFGHNKGAFVEWYQENDGAAGQFTLQIRYSGNKKNSPGRGIRLTVNDQSKELMLPNTKDYGKDWQIFEQSITLGGGANTIRLTTIESGGMYIDEITVK
ncbi:MAG: sugar-binding domain-containing protein [Opitutaceae bacterium]